MEYFTPDIEDIRVGYECEINTDRNARHGDSDWNHIIIDGDLYHGFGVDLSRLRVPYLTKEQIEAEGWKLKGITVDIWWEKEGYFEINNWTSRKIVMHYGMKGHVGYNDCRLYIYAEDMGDEHMLFEGECKDINTFRYICKLLKIN